MRCSVARLCERTVGRRVQPLWAGGGLLHTTPHCVVVTVSGAELVSFASHTERRLVPTGANRRRSRDRQRGTSCPKGEMSEANESTCGVTESRTVLYGGGWRGRSLSVVGNGRSRELCEALELARCTLRADHLRFFTSNHSRPQAATINTTMMLHGIDEVGSSLDGFTREGDLTSMLLTEDGAMVCS